MRGLLSALEADGRLHRVGRSIDPRFEIASVLALREHGPAQIFENVAGHAIPVVGNLFNSRERFPATANPVDAPNSQGRRRRCMSASAAIWTFIEA